MNYQKFTMNLSHIIHYLNAKMSDQSSVRKDHLISKGVVWDVKSFKFIHYALL